MSAPHFKMKLLFFSVLFFAIEKVRFCSYILQVVFFASRFDLYSGFVWLLWALNFFPFLFYSERRQTLSEKASNLIFLLDFSMANTMRPCFSLCTTFQSNFKLYFVIKSCFQTQNLFLCYDQIISAFFT